MGKLIVNCLPLTADERREFVETVDAAAESSGAVDIRQEFEGDPSRRGAMRWSAMVPERLRAQATAVIGNIDPTMCAPAVMPRLEWLQTWSAGVERYLAPGVLGGGVRVTSASGAYGQAVSEHLFAMMWALMKNLPGYVRRQESRDWHDLGRVATPAGSLVLVVGAGDIGSHFARLCKAMGAHTVGVRRDPGRPADGVDEMHGFADLDDLLPAADVVALAVPAAPDTVRLIDARRLALMGPGAILLNAGRGALVDTDALAESLAAGRLRGAGLDVTDPEPLPADSPLWSEPRCLITPHVAGGNHLESTERRIIAIALENVRRYVAGEPLTNVRR